MFEEKNHWDVLLEAVKETDNKDEKETEKEVEKETEDEVNVFKAYKYILAYRSSVFKKMFENEMEEKKTNHVLIESIAEYVFKEMLRFIYIGKVFNINKLAFELIQAADRYDVPHLKRCEQLIRRISIDNCIEYFIFAL